MRSFSEGDPPSQGPTVPEFGRVLHRLFLDACDPQRSLTVKSMARAVSVSERSLYAYFNGETLIPADVLTRFLTELQVAGQRREELLKMRTEVRLARSRVTRPTAKRTASKALWVCRDAPVVVDRHLRTGRPWTAVLPADDAGALFYLGAVQRMVGQYRESIGPLVRALEAQKHENSLFKANCLGYLGIALRINGDFPAAEDNLVRALRLYEKVESRRGRAAVLLQLGIVHGSCARHAAAEDALSRSMDWYSSLRDDHGKAGVLLERGVLHRRMGNSGLAKQALDDSLQVYEQLGSRLGQLNARIELASLGGTTAPSHVEDGSQPCAWHASGCDFQQIRVATGDGELVQGEVMILQSGVDLVAAMLANTGPVGQLWLRMHHAALALALNLQNRARDDYRSAISLAGELESACEGMLANRGIAKLPPPS